MSDATETKQRIQVTFGVDLPLQEIELFQKILKDSPRGSDQYLRAFDKLKQLHTHHVGRIDGECAAYMNIAKTELKQIFGM